MPDRIVDLIISLKSRCLEKEESIRLEFGLSPAEYRGILAMTPNEPCNCNALAVNMGLSVSRGSRVVEKLIKNKYLLQEVSKADRRNIILRLAPKGVKVRSKIEAVLNECETTIESRLSGAEIKNTIKLFHKLEDCL
jgi:DNA-binding MarR family transcriptional regulator